MQTDLTFMQSLLTVIIASLYMLELLLLHHRVQPPLVHLLTLFAVLHAVTPYFLCINCIP
jgi:hypothetical protein